MKKKYIAPSMEVATIETTQMLATSQSVGISNTTTTQQWGRGTNDDWGE